MRSVVGWWTFPTGKGCNVSGKKSPRMSPSIVGCMPCAHDIPIFPLVFNTFFGVLSILMFHRHHWEIKGVSYTPPPEKFQGTQNGPADMLERLYRRMHEGVTHVYLFCQKCGEPREVDFYGRFDPAAVPGDSELAQLRKMAGV